MKDAQSPLESPDVSTSLPHPFFYSCPVLTFALIILVHLLFPDRSDFRTPPPTSDNGPILPAAHHDGLKNAHHCHHSSVCRYWPQLCLSARQISLTTVAISRIGPRTYPNLHALPPPLIQILLLYAVLGNPQCQAKVFRRREGSWGPETLPCRAGLQGCPTRLLVQTPCLGVASFPQRKRKTLAFFSRRCVKSSFTDSL